MTGHVLNMIKKSANPTCEQTPAASTTVPQHFPWTSTTIPVPLQAPHASTTAPLGQHLPATSMELPWGQHVPEVPNSPDGQHCCSASTVPLAQDSSTCIQHDHVLLPTNIEKRSSHVCCCSINNQHDPKMQCVTGTACSVCSALYAISVQQSPQLQSWSDRQNCVRLTLLSVLHSTV